MINVSNVLSFLRVPFAFLFLVESSSLRCFAVVLAMITDSVDGYLARKRNVVTKFGMVLDPLTDKFFVYFALSALFLEGKLSPWQVTAMLSRDIAVIAYSLLILLMGRTKSITFRSLWAGKASTALQFIVLIGLAFDLSFSWITYSAFFVMGAIAFMELSQSSKGTQSPFKMFHAGPGK